MVFNYGDVFLSLLYNLKLKGIFCFSYLDFNAYLKELIKKANVMNVPIYFSFSVGSLLHYFEIHTINGIHYYQLKKDFDIEKLIDSYTVNYSDQKLLFLFDGALIEDLPLKH